MSTALSEPATTKRSAWYLLAFLILLNVFNFVDRQLITSLQIPLRQDPELHLSPVQNQLLAGYAFSVVYATSGLVLGNLADRWHRPRLVALGLLVWSAMTASSGLAHNFWQLALARIFVGIGESTLTPASVAMLGDVFQPRRRSLATGLYYMGIPIGAGLSLVVANLLWPIPWIGWRGCFQVLGLIGVCMVGILWFVKDPPRGAMDDPTAIHMHQHVGAPLPAILRAFRQAPALGLTMVGTFLVNISVGTTWLDPTWLYEERGFTRERGPIFLGIALIIGGSAGNILGGWLGDHFRKHWKGGQVLALVVLQLAIMPFMVLYRFLPADWFVALAVCCCVSSMTITFIYGPVLSTIQELTPVRLRATMVAILLIGLNIFGASLGSVIAAALEKPLQRYTVQSYTWAIFITAQAAVLALPLFYFAFRRYASDLARLGAAEEEDLT
jgi:MFS family permease